MFDRRKIVIGVGVSSVIIIILSSTATTSDDSHTNRAASNLSNNDIEGLLISGVGTLVNRVEVFLPDSVTNCPLPSLPHPGRGGHTHLSSLACGGTERDSWTSCDLWTGSGWRRAGVTLRHRRAGHVAWEREEGVLLMGGGGEDSLKTTELVSWDGSNSEESFPLKHETFWGCSIPDQEMDTLIITAWSKVSQYGSNGWLQDLPSLRTSRYQHGCAQFRVGSEKALLVTGGSNSLTFLASTEVLLPGASRWMEVGELPLALHGLRGTTLGLSQVYMTGGVDNDGVWQDSILKYNMEGERWETVGQMITPRAMHAVTAVNIRQFKQFCNV